MVKGVLRWRKMPSRKAYFAARYQANKERILERVRAYNRNPEKKPAINANQRRRRRLARLADRVRTPG
jgi:hypothetical protein